MMEIILLGAIICNFILGLFVFLKDPFKMLHRLFGIFCFVTVIWIFVNLMMGVMKTSFWLKSSYAVGSLVPITGLLWILELCEKRLTKSKVFLLGCVGFIFFIISYINNLIVTNVKRVYLGGFEGKVGPFFIFYFLYICGVSAFNLYTLFSEYRKAKEIKRLQIGYVLLGAVLYSGTVSVVSFVLPLFGIVKFTALDSPSSLFLVVFTTLAILRYHLFEIRVILTEILIAAMGIILFLLPFLMPTVNLKVLTLAVFVLFLIFAYYLLKATYEESKRREEAEKLAEKERAQRERAERFKVVSTKLKEKLSQTLELETILKNIREVLSEAFQTKKFSFAIKQVTTEFFEIKKIDGFLEEPSLIIRDTPLCLYLEKYKRIFTPEILSSLIEESKDKKEKEELKLIQKRLKDLEIELLLPLFQKDAIVGIIFLGPKLNNLPYTQEDIELLETLSYQMSIAIQNSLLYEELKKDMEILERFYKTTIGRELKMRELKQKIKELEEKLKEKEGEENN